MLQVQALQKSFDGFLAVNDTTLTVEKGDVLAVIGLNGAGKYSTVSAFLARRR